MDDVTIARAIHVLAVVHWIGGVIFVTTVILPAVSRIAEPARRLEMFEAIEQRFSRQVKVSVPLAGLSGAYMAERLDIWGRFVTPGGWWLMAMVLVWLVFMAMLFVIEPFVHKRFHRAAMGDPTGTFRRVQRAHWVLGSAAAVVAAAAVAGAHGALG
ncbi:MAG: hypothetical protein JSS04_09000 [Proteobacteria bacterium]|nr:hypothetical protein [Pseudomonadota bacterium]